MSAPAPWLEALITYLSAQSAITALAGTRIFGLGLPQSQIASMPQNCVVLNLSPNMAMITGRPTYMEDAVFNGMDVWCYGRTNLEAMKLSREVHRVLKRIETMTQSGVRIYSVHAPGSPVFLKDPDGDWPVCIEQCSVLASEVMTT